MISDSVYCIFFVSRILKDPAHSFHLVFAHSHRKGGNKEAIFYFGDRFCYVNESQALELYSHSLTQLLFLTRFFFFVKAIHFSLLSFFFGWVGRAPSTTRLRTSSEEFAESVTVYWPSQFPDSFLVRT